MVSSVLSSGKSSLGHKKGKSSGGKSSGGSGKKTASTAETTTNFTTICMTVFIFRGEPDFSYNRHVLMYFTSPDLPNFFETVHAQRQDDRSPWVVDQIHQEIDWALTRTYNTHVNAGAVVVYPGQEMAPVNIFAAIRVGHRPGDWNCQHFLYEGMQELVNQGFQQQEWCDMVTNETMDKVFEGSLG